MARRKPSKPGKPARAGKRRAAELPATLKPALEQAMAALQQGRPAVAEPLLADLRRQVPDHPAVNYLLGMVHAGSDRLDSAIELLQRAAELSPANPMFQFALGDACLRCERFDEAVATLRRAVRLDGGFRDAYAALGMALYQAKRYPEAGQAFREALRLDPGDVRLHMNAAASAIESNDPEAALPLLTRAEELAAGADRQLLLDLARLYRRLGEVDAAVRNYRAVLSQAPDDPAVWDGLGFVLAKSQRMTEAKEAFGKAAALRGDPGLAYRAIADAAGANGLVDEALSHYRLALARTPTDFSLRSGQLLYQNYLADVSPEALFEEHRAIADCVPAEDDVAFANPCDDRRALRIGYVSADLRRHSVAFFISPVLKHHDRKAVQVYCYFNGEEADATTRRLQGHVHAWRDIHDLDDQAVVERVREDGIDILVDLSGHTTGNRLAVFARRAAPVQVTWLGYPNTTGIPAMDYRLSDGRADPQGQTDRWHTERVVRLPRVFSVYQPPADCLAVAPPPCERNGHVTFGSFNNYNKLNDFVLELWADVLLAVPDSRLLLKDRNFASEAIRERVLGVFAARGVAAERIELRRKDLSRERHQASFADMDIGLDPFPYCGTTTTCETLWMGVPVITLAGQDHRSRVGLSQLSAIGLGDLVAHGRDEYVAIARRLAADPERIMALRAGMRARLRASPLMDYAGFTRELETIYRTLWQEWCSGREPG